MSTVVSGDVATIGRTFFAVILTFYFSHAIIKSIVTVFSEENKVAVLQSAK